jgi:hypothetical protein
VDQYEHHCSSVLLLIYTLLILWHVDSLLGNDREISHCRTAVGIQWPINSNRGMHVVDYASSNCKSNSDYKGFSFEKD